jgi:ribosome maturation factor RimP
MTPNPRELKNKLLAIAEPVCAANGYELVDLDYESGNAGWVVRFYIDHVPLSVARLSGGISFEDCERLSRELSAVLDVEDPVPHAYSLEVSSPGVDRPLRTAAHFRAQLGQTAKVHLHDGLDGRRNFKGRVVGVAGEGATAAVTLEVDGVEFALPVGDVQHARLVPDWDAVLRANRAGKNKGKGKRPDKGSGPGASGSPARD